MANEATIPRELSEPVGDDEQPDVCEACQGKGKIETDATTCAVNFGYPESGGKCYLRCLTCRGTGKASVALARKLARA